MKVVVHRVTKSRMPVLEIQRVVYLYYMLYCAASTMKPVLAQGYQVITEVER